MHSVFTQTCVASRSTAGRVTGTAAARRERGLRSALAGDGRRLSAKAAARGEALDDDFDKGELVRQPPHLNFYALRRLNYFILLALSLMRRVQACWMNLGIPRSISLLN